MSINRVWLMTMLAADLLAMACGTIPGSARSSTGTPAVSITPDARCERLLRRQVFPCPPARLTPEAIVIHNGTRGAVSDAAARSEGDAYVRVHTIADWAVRQDAGGTFLMSGAIVSPEIARTNVFRTEVRVFTDAGAAGGRVRIEPLRTTEITLVPVPPALQDVARSDGLSPSPYGWVDNQAGPARVSVQGADGSAREVLSIAAGEPHPVLVLGEVRQDADLGSIWYLGGDFGCLASPQVRVVCQL